MVLKFIIILLDCNAIVEEVTESDSNLTLPVRTDDESHTICTFQCKLCLKHT